MHTHLAAYNNIAPFLKPSPLADGTVRTRYCDFWLIFHSQDTMHFMEVRWMDGTLIEARSTLSLFAEELASARARLLSMSQLICFV